MEQRNQGQFPRTESNDNSVWTVDGSQQRLATAKPKSETVTLFGQLSRKRLESCLTLALLAILILIFALIVTIYLVTESPVIFNNVCYSHSCIRSASNLLESMNGSLNPCDNFFKYACGEWRVHHAGPEPYWSNSWFVDRAAIQKRDVIAFLSQEDIDSEPGGVKDARKVFKACLDIDAQDATGIDSLWKLFDKLHLPRNPLNRTYEPDPWIETLARVKRYLAMDIFIGTGITTSISDSSRNQIVASIVADDETLPGWNWERRTLYSEIRKKMIVTEDEDDDDIGSDEVLENWIKYGSRLINYLIEESGEAFLESDTAEAAHNILNIIRNISLIEESENVTGSILNEVPTEMDLISLQEIIDNGTSSGTSQLQLESFFDVLFTDFPELELNFTSDKILVFKKPYFQLLAEYLETLDDNEINLFIWWNVVFTLAPHTHEDLKLLKENMVNKIFGDYVSDTRTTVCMRTVYTLMSPALGYFILEKVEHDKISKVNAMVESIRSAFLSYIENLKWMDPSTKKASVEKLNHFNIFVGIPEWMKNHTEFEDLYVNVTLAGDDHFQNLLNLLDSIMVSTVNSLRITNDRNSTDFDPLDINAYYDPSANSITVPYGILQFPFYDLGVEALNYGALGTVLGHEMAHGFDNTGRKFDKFGNVHPWWSTSSIEKFKNRTVCFETEYSDFPLPNVNSSVVKIDGKLTLGENLADDGGLKFAYNAYNTYIARHGQELQLPGLHNFTHQQLFFLSFANLWCSEYSVTALIESLRDEHSPDLARVLIVLQNSPEFSEAWKCPKGSYMNPDHKCSMWTR